MNDFPKNKTFQRYLASGISAYSFGKKNLKTEKNNFKPQLMFFPFYEATNLPNIVRNLYIQFLPVNKNWSIETLMREVHTVGMAKINNG